jgi:integrase/recombinase XerD
MKKHNPNNERIKRQYLRFLKESKGQNEASLDAVAMAFSRFEIYTKYSDFKKFHYEQAIGFKKYLAIQTSHQTGKPISLSTQKTTLRHLKTFFQWLAMQTGYKSKLNFTDSEYFNLSEKQSRIASTSKSKSSPTLKQIHKVIDSMPYESDIEKRDRALVAFILITAARDSAVASAKLKHINLVEGFFDQDAKEVDTKFSKTFKTYFMPVGGLALQIVEDWIHHLRTNLYWGDDDPLFPQTEIGQSDERQFMVVGLKRQNWSTANPIRKIFRVAFESAGLPYFHPHLFRNTLVKYGAEICRSPEQFKAWSQNIGHSNVLTTFTSYGEVAEDRQGELIQNMTGNKSNQDSNLEERVKAIVLNLNI